MAKRLEPLNNVEGKSIDISSEKHCITSASTTSMDSAYSTMAKTGTLVRKLDPSFAIRKSSLKVKYRNEPILKPYVITVFWDNVGKCLCVRICSKSRLKVDSKSHGEESTSRLLIRMEISLCAFSEYTSSVVCQEEVAPVHPSQVSFTREEVEKAKSKTYFFCIERTEWEYEFELVQQKSKKPFHTTVGPPINGQIQTLLKRSFNIQKLLPALCGEHGHQVVVNLLVRKVKDCFITSSFCPEKKFQQVEDRMGALNHEAILLPQSLTLIESDQVSVRLSCTSQHDVAVSPERHYFLGRDLLQHARSATFIIEDKQNKRLILLHEIHVNDCRVLHNTFPFSLHGHVETNDSESKMTQYINFGKYGAVNVDASRTIAQNLSRDKSNIKLLQNDSDTLFTML